MELYSSQDVPPVIILYHPSMETVATTIFDEIKRRQTNLKAKQYRHVALKTDISWKRFRDGWPNIFIENVEEIAGRDVVFLASFHSPDSVLFEQLSLLYMLPRYFIRSFRVILPFFPTGTMERVDYEGQIVTAKSLSQMLSVIPIAARGPTQLIMFDIHALQERFYFSEQVIPRLLSAVPLLIRRLKEHPNRSNIHIVYPDEGAFTRFHTIMEAHGKEWPIVKCTKVRRGEERIVTIKEGEASGHHLVIIDDLIQTGGTLMECAKALSDEGALSISAYVTHPVFPNQSWKRFTETPPVQLDAFWITDSIPHAYEICRYRPFQLISVADAIVDSLFKYDLPKETA